MLIRAGLPESGTQRTPGPEYELYDQDFDPNVPSLTDVPLRPYQSVEYQTLEFINISRVYEFTPGLQG